MQAGLNNESFLLTQGSSSLELPDKMGCLIKSKFQLNNEYFLV